ncbi:rCG25611, isoform CRA_a [Rattus norvegicus]|uniref:RCG25611, isoform CRA_a n=1 Tax=Rattus norvegicus TaxID=10116 RepID=A6I1I7_RAT|nr:rCG25611, isoform CRA_a [Rattus norvegicus]
MNRVAHVQQPSNPQSFGQRSAKSFVVVPEAVHLRRRAVRNPLIRRPWP